MSINHMPIYNNENANERKTYAQRKYFCMTVQVYVQVEEGMAKTTAINAA